MNLNKVFILGRLTADPQLRTTPTGQQVASFGVATNRIWNDKTGSRQQEVEYHNVVVWGRQAEIVSQFLTKGSLLLVEGRMRTRTWQNKQGQNQRTTEIIGERIQLGPRSSQSQTGFNKPEAEETKSVSPKKELPEIDINEEDIKAEDLPF
ncbi:single-stranded DNA-binding protein [Candidatus Wolfebacteria bacterium CG18_big_fil_WC_8_21_14_2_50_39_7]|uniref:Single-stranded DNA-binding protein n=5 Tax=Candidatus Wolfeibacteriota TaxID=1752735 RepID=A0A2M7Q739_9BACT|nr:single-stranded DNA-binding protein [Parcubacteria group bacterium]NCO89282.1 single-stranded DNA-binding protein [Candidatus Wolfebacteria bacterium]OIO65162.1 MAG: single-stranded DNA-binding protein [Candidatus Wolfebacteria bacterium CG1_02_39_135]PIP92051.1 MAG: single-stranded DNA-binding protein [Candidatus Wolfebacteria bacterium CG18_big_fil_WC_8_21_14_2_50_39_7]PIU98781.1 MAG: single-stranded DNA-binding protein [Candidatus Wolfebacteria bacterium CG03_land_8_20_14_0_80_39_317]PIY